jgi:glycosyltransferase involved in cell wall biosynthesis
MLLNSADAVVLPYQIALGYSQPPLTLIEALIHGKPVISTLCGSVPEFIVSGENGILVQPGDPAALARGMHQFATRSLAHRAEEIRSSVIHKHDWPAIVDTHLRVYEGVLQAAGS